MDTNTSAQNTHSFSVYGALLITVGVFIALIALGEKSQIAAIIGSIMAIIGIILVIIGKNRNKQIASGSETLLDK